MRYVVAAVLAVALGVTLVALYTRYLGRATGHTVTSWWRSPWHNKAVGGRSGSIHILGWAVDLVPATEEVEAAARAAGFPVVVNEGDHVHAAWFQS